MSLSRQEKLILLLVALVIATRYGYFLRDIAIARIYGPVELAPAQQHQWELVTFLIRGLLNVGAAVWIYLEAQLAKRTAWVWALLGIFFGLTGLLLYYLVDLSLAHRDTTRRIPGRET